jgi:hypothetical protein
LTLEAAEAFAGYISPKSLMGDYGGIATKKTEG